MMGSRVEWGLGGINNQIAACKWGWDPSEGSLKVIDELGGPKYYNHFPAGWAHAMDTPFQWTKQIASHFGGTRNPVVISWPAKIKQSGVRTQFHHITDIMPTILEVAGIRSPDMLHGVAQ